MVVAVHDSWELKRQLRERRNRERQGWAHLGSLWMHMLAVVALGTLGPIEPAEKPAPIELVMLELELPPENGASSGELPRLGTGEEGPEARFNPGLMEGDGDGLGLGTGAEDRGHEEREISEELPKDGELFVREEAEAPENPADHELPDEVQPSEQALAEAEEREASDAVAEAEAREELAHEPETATEPPETSIELPEKTEELAEPEPEELPEETPIEELDDEMFKRFVRSNENQAGARPDEAAFIAAYNLEDPQIRRAIVDAQQWGQRARSVQGTTFKPKEKVLNLPDGDPVELAGNLQEDAEAEVANAPEEGGGGGQKGELQEKTVQGGGVQGEVSGTPTSAPREAVRPTERAVQIEPQEAPPVRRPRPGGRFKEAPQGEFAPSSTPDWWQPMATMVIVKPRPQAPPEPSPAAVVTEVVPEPAPEVREPKPEGETVLEEEGAEESSTEESPAEADVVAEIEDELEAEEPSETLVDTMQELQEAFGVGPRKQEKDNPRSNPDVNGQEGAPSASTQAVLDIDDPFAETVFVRAVSDARGRYTEMLYQIITAAWYKLDLPPHEKAIGVQGRVQVKFRVQANGTITDVMVSRSSGHPALDAMALQAIPAKAPPFPDDLQQASLAQRMTFRYRNPLIATSTD